MGRYRSRYNAHRGYPSYESKPLPSGNLTPGITPGVPHQVITAAQTVVQSWSLLELSRAHDMTTHPLASQDQCEARSTPERLSADNGAYWMAGITTTKMAADILALGWREGADRMERITRDFTPPTAKSRRRRSVWRDEGDEIRLDTAMAGNWDTAWRSTRREWVPGKTTVTIVTGWGGHAGLNSEQLFWQGAAAVMLSDALESAGYSVRIVAGFTLDGIGGRGVIFVTIKDESEPLRVDAAASLMCHAGIFRAYAWRAACFLPFRLGYGHGSPTTDWPSSRVEELKRAGAWFDDAITIGTIYSQDGCLRELNKVLASIQSEGGQCLTS